MSRGLLLLAMGSALTTGAWAQDRTGLPPGTVVQPLDQGAGAGAELRRNLTALALNPRSVTALNGAGRAALEMGDADAALSFFARASDAEPRNPRARAGMAQALVHLERAGDAMPLFAEAIALGAPETEIAADRGLAWDSLGQPARAQADYALSLRREDDPEVRRRLALSLAISGRRDEALSIIDGQLRNRDRAALRTRAFILALTGDAAGAGQTARDSMPAGADALAPYLGRLASLSPSQKALAVHFGHFPSDGRAAAYAQADTSPDAGAIALAQGTAPMGGPRQPPAFDTNPGRRRPGDSGPPLASQIRRPATPVQAQSRRTVQIAELQTRRAQQRPAQGQAPPWAEPVLDDGQPPSQTQRRQPRDSAPAWAEPVLDERERSPGFTLVPQGRPLGTPNPVRTQPEPVAPAETGADFSSVTAFVNSLPAEEEVAPAVGTAPARTRGQPPAANSRTRTAAARAAQAAGRTGRARPPASPSRVWVQMAIGNSKAGLVYQYGAFRRQAPALLGGRGAYTAQWNATNRLLVGPFASESAGRAFVGQLAARGVQAHTWTSEAGQEIDALQGANDSRTPIRTAEEPRQPAGSRSARNRAGREQAVAAASRAGRSAQRQQPAASRSSRSAQRQQPAAGSRASRAARTQAAVVAKKDPPAAARASRGRSQAQQGTASRRRRSN
ncbi:MAG: hypothetical protein QOD42_2246 [Sphingomonadales bacterium]|nr:hypothetical protein [Sphingomonadales bacterium]